MLQDHRNVIAWGCDEDASEVTALGALWLLGMTLAVMTALKDRLGRLLKRPAQSPPSELASSRDSISPAKVTAHR